MDAQIKAKWVEALRSGEYKQGSGHLHDQKTDCYCCLGVLCKVMGAEFGEAQEIGVEDEEPFFRSYDYVPVLGGRVISSRDDEELSGSFLKEVGIQDQSILIGMNDGCGKPDEAHYEAPQPFAVIADFIEKNL